MIGMQMCAVDTRKLGVSLAAKFLQLVTGAPMGAFHVLMLHLLQCIEPETHDGRCWPQQTAGVNAATQVFKVTRLA